MALSLQGLKSEGQNWYFLNTSHAGKTSYSLLLIAQTSSFIDMSPTEEYPEPEDNFISEERELQEEGEEKEEDIPENANTEMISMETLLKVFRGGNEPQDTNRFASYPKTESIYSEVG